VGGRDFITSSAGRGFEGKRLQVPAGHVYVLGDHRDMSNDSRNTAIGAVPIKRIKGRALAFYWSRGEDGLRWDRMFTAVR
jgi:signal peptidase I